MRKSRWYLRVRWANFRMLPAQRRNSWVMPPPCCLGQRTSKQGAPGPKTHNVKNCFLPNMLVVVVVVIPISRVMVLLIVVGGLGHTFALALCDQPFKRYVFLERPPYSFVLPSAVGEKPPSKGHHLCIHENLAWKNGISRALPKHCNSGFWSLHKGPF